MCPTSTPPSSPAFSMPAARSSARRIASISASPAAATPAPTGPVHNPHKMGYSAGGSSSGSAVVVATGEVDMAIGGDQGGSIRMPASFCGIYGMKATHGLVPYTGVMPIEITLDHTGPMTATVRDNALLLEVLAGADGLDPRQYAPKGRALHRRRSAAASRACASAWSRKASGSPNSEADVDAKVEGGRRAVPQARRDRRGGLDPDAPARARRSGCRSPPKARPS